MTVRRTHSCWPRLFCAAVALDDAWSAHPDAQSATAAALTSAFLYNFAKFTEWPADSLAPGQRLALCVLGDNAVAGALEQTIKGHAIESHELTVELLKPDASARSCHLLYVSGLDEKRSAPADRQPEKRAGAHGERREPVRRARRRRPAHPGERPHAFHHQRQRRAARAAAAQLEAAEPGAHHQGRIDMSSTQPVVPQPLARAQADGDRRHRSHRVAGVRIGGAGGVRRRERTGAAGSRHRDDHRRHRASTARLRSASATPRAATDILSALRVNTHVKTAAILLPNGRILARFDRDESQPGHRQHRGRRASAASNPWHRISRRRR